MKKTVIILSVLVLIVSSCSQLKSVSASQKQNIIGLWDFREDRIIMEFTKNINRKLPNKEPIKYKIVGNEIIFFMEKKEVAGIWRYELQGNDTLIINAKGQRAIGKRIIINPNKNRTLQIGKYASDKSDISVEILDKSEALFFSSESGQGSVHYLIVDTKLYLIESDYYLFEIKDNGFIQGLIPEEIKGVIFERIEK